MTSTAAARHVVVLSIRWNCWCNKLCEMSISHSRRVFFDAQARVVHVDGDRPAKVIALQEPCVRRPYGVDDRAGGAYSTALSAVIATLAGGVILLPQYFTNRA